MTIENRSHSRHWVSSSAKPAKPRLRNHSPLNPQDELLEGFQPHPGRRMTEEEFLAWVGEKTRAEWVDGEVIIMSPVSDRHADIHGWLSSILRSWLEENDLGYVRGDVMVRLSKPRSRRVPDIYFFSKERASLQRSNHFEGPPDVIFEIVSPDSTARDYRDKHKSYEASGVKEYWIIDPLVNRMEASELYKGHYRTLGEKEGIIRSKAIKGFFIRPEWCTRMPLPKVAEVLRELSGK
jgi:Uma2 family endonuclease